MHSFALVCGACRSGRADLAKRWLPECHPYGLSMLFNALFLACRQGGECVQLMIEHALREGLRGACAGGHTDLARRMLERCCVGLDGALLAACAGGHEDCALLVLDRGASCICAALRVACAKGRVAVARTLIARGAAIAEEGDVQCDTFAAACSASSPAITRLLLDSFDCSRAIDDALAKDPVDPSIARLLVRTGAARSPGAARFNTRPLLPWKTSWCTPIVTLLPAYCPQLFVAQGRGNTVLVKRHLLLLKILTVKKRRGLHLEPPATTKAASAATTKATTAAAEATAATATSATEATSAKAAAEAAPAAKATAEAASRRTELDVGRQLGGDLKGGDRVLP
eukprot:TRINITY_DN1342_c0_g1_i5.p1 TRINITY_DN1342_c0_g1~~TRINITY_DN1342_c0_g1_i5.p1  ORF type:complete len:342 (+),score=67.43 TRINITY_DN1342_c0_g1_i5:825-1850(+)